VQISLFVRIECAAQICAMILALWGSLLLDRHIPCSYPLRYFWLLYYQSRRIATARHSRASCRPVDSHRHVMTHEPLCATVWCGVLQCVLLCVAVCCRVAVIRHSRAPCPPADTHGHIVGVYTTREEKEKATRRVHTLRQTDTQTQDTHTERYTQAHVGVYMTRERKAKATRRAHIHRRKTHTQINDTHTQRNT